MDNLQENNDEITPNELQKIMDFMHNIENMKPDDENSSQFIINCINLLIADDNRRSILLKNLPSKPMKGVWDNNASVVFNFIRNSNAPDNKVYQLFLASDNLCNIFDRIKTSIPFVSISCNGKQILQIAHEKIIPHFKKFIYKIYNDDSLRYDGIDIIKKDLNAIIHGKSLYNTLMDTYVSNELRPIVEGEVNVISPQFENEYDKNKPHNFFNAIKHNMSNLKTNILNRVSRKNNLGGKSRHQRKYKRHFKSKKIRKYKKLLKSKKIRKYKFNK